MSPGPNECSTDRVHGSSASKGGIITSRLLQASHRRTYDLRVDRLRQISLRRHGCGDPWSTVGASVVSTLVMNVGRHHLQRWLEQCDAPATSARTVRGVDLPQPWVCADAGSGAKRAGAEGR